MPYKVDDVASHRSNSYENYGWQPFDPASYAPPKALLQDPHNYFYANLRRKQASGAWLFDPTPVLSVMTSRSIDQNRLRSF